MPHVYDTGLAVPQRTAIRAAVVQRLSALKRPGLYLRAVGVLPTRISGNDDGIDAIATALGSGNYPAALVALGRGDIAAAGMPASRARKEIEILVYLISGHGRGQVEGRLVGDIRSADVTQDPGIDAMLEHVEQALVGVDLGIRGVEEIRPDAESEIFSGDDAAVWELSFKVRVDRSVNHSRLVTQLLTEIDTAHHVAGADPANPVSVNRTPIGAP